MQETVWYYARGEVERGPFTTIQIKALANAGKLCADDLVWKEGMENWTSAAEVPELFADRPSEPKATAGSSPTEPVAARNPFLERTTRPPSEFEKLVTIGCRSSLYVGMLCVLLVQGCESIGERRIAGLASGAAPSVAPEVVRAQAELSDGAFGRGVILFGGVLFLLVGAAGLATFATAADRWLGIAIVGIICFCLLTLALK